MKTLFIPVMSKNSKITNFNAALKKFQDKLPKNLAIAYSVQFKELAINIRNQLEKDKNHKITIFTQVLGCSNPKLSDSTEALLLIGQGRFHALGLAIETKLPIYIYEAGKLTQISQSEIDKIEKKHKAAYIKYLSAKEVGILITTKPGQNRLKRAIDLKNKLKDKKPYLFIANNIDPAEFENFDIQSWINTACPRMDMNDSSIINISRLE